LLFLLRIGGQVKARLSSSGVQPRNASVDRAPAWAPQSLLRRRHRSNAAYRASEATIGGTLGWTGCRRVPGTTGRAAIWAGRRAPRRDWAAQPFGPADERRAAHV